MMPSGKARPTVGGPGDDGGHLLPQRERESLCGYVFLDELSNGQRRVVKAKAKEGDAFVAIKYLPPEATADEEVSRNIGDDFQIANSLDCVLVAHPLAIHEANGRVCVVYEWVSGQNLGTRVVRSGRLSETDACEVIRQAARGLQSLFDGGLFHGGICPNALMLTESGLVKIIDVGLFHAYAHEARHDPANVGPYAAPEFGLQEDIRTDIYSLGLTLVYLLTGHESPGLVFDTESQAWAGAPPHFKELLGRAPALLERVLKKSLARSVECRYEKPSQMAADLSAICERGWLMDQRDAAAGADEATIEGSSIGSQAWLRRPTKEAILGTVVLLSVGLAAFLAGLIWSWCSRPIVDDRDDHFRLAKAMSTLPGREGTWWAQSEDVYWLLPPVRRNLVESIRVGKAGLPEAFELFDSANIDNEEGENEPSDGNSLLDDTRACPLYQCLRNWAHEEVWESADGSAGPQPRPDYQEFADVFDVLRPETLVSYRYDERLRWCISTIPPDTDDPTKLHLRAVLMHLAALRQPGGNGQEATQQKPAPTAPEASADQPATGGSGGGQPPGEPPAAERNKPGQAWEDAIATYQKALELYQWHEVDLKALCHADFGQLLQARKHYDAAAEQFQTARRLARSRPPSRAPIHHFVVDLLCSEANAYRKSGQWSRAEEALERATRKVEHLQDSPGLNAYVLERFGWYLMDRWRVDKARDKFSQAREKRLQMSGHPQNQADWYRNQLRALHDKHGEAMAHRYNGATEQSRESYQSVIEQLEKHLEVVTQEHWKRAFEAQLLNTRERLADCELYGAEKGDQAAEQIDQALGLLRRHNVLRGMAWETWARLQYKKAMALVLAGDPDRAKETRDLAWNKRKEEIPDDRLSDKLGLVEALVTKCVDNELAKAGGNDDREDCEEELFETIEAQYTKLNRKDLISRDELDLLQLVARRLSEDPLGLRAELLRRLGSLPRTVRDVEGKTVRDAPLPTREALQRTSAKGAGPVSDKTKGA